MKFLSILYSDQAKVCECIASITRDVLNVHNGDFEGDTHEHTSWQHRQQLAGLRKIVALPDLIAVLIEYLNTTAPIVVVELQEYMWILHLYICIFFTG